MSYYSTAPVTAADAKTAGQRAALRGKWLLVVAIMAGFVGVIALFFLIDDPSASPAWITLLICVAICTVFGSLTRMVNKRRAGADTRLEILRRPARVHDRALRWSPAPNSSSGSTAASGRVTCVCSVTPQAVCGITERPTPLHDSQSMATDT